MAALPAKFCLWFMVFFIILWMIYILCSRLLDFILSRVLGASVRFRVVGWRCLRHLVVKFEKGAIESVLAGEIKLSLRSLIKLAIGVLREDQKMQVSICKLKVKMRFSAALFCDELSVSSDFGYDREVGMVIRSMEILCRDVSLKFASPKSKRSSSSVQDEVGTSSTTALYAKKQLLATVAKYSTYVPEKVSFSLPKLDIIFENQEHQLLAKNNITGIQFTSVKSKPVEYTRESTRLDIRLELSEIHLFKEAESSVLEIMKVYVESSIEIPIQPDLSIRADIDIKLGGTRCNLFISRLQPWLRLHFLKKRNMVLEEETHTLENSEAAADMKTVLWRGTVSAPEMTIMLYAIDGLPMYHFCSQSSHVFVNNYLSRGTTMDVELGELNLHLGDEYQECFEENLFGIASNSDLLMHIAKVSLNWKRRRMVLSIGVPRMGIYICFKRVESLLTNAMSFKALFDETGGAQQPKATGKGICLVYFRLGRCCVNFCDDTRLDNTVIDDPDAVHYGTPRTVSILSTASEEFERLKYSVSLEISQFSFFINKAKHSTQMKLERAISIYRDYLEEHTSSSEVTLFDIHNAKLKRRPGGLNEIDVNSLFSATDILVRWEPDVHLSLYEPFLRLKSLVYEQRLKEDESISGVEDGGPSEEANQLDSVDEQKKKEYMFAIDVETLMISAEVGHGVEFKLKAQSIFSENACVGVLLEGLTLAFKGSRVVKSTRMQISRTGPSSLNLFDTDWLVQGPDMHICIPYKLQLGAIADSIEDMFRGLRIITLAKEKLIIPGKRETSSKPKISSPKFGCIRLYILKLTADIEEEPIQGWLDEHYQLMKKEACELAVRLKFLEDFIHKATQSPKGAERELFLEGNGIDVEDPSVINKLKEKIHKRSFQAYYQACKGLVPSEGSGGYTEGFQAGFKPSAARTYLLSVCFTYFDLTLTSVNGGGADLMEVLKNLDPISEEISESNVDLKTGSLVVQLRNYTLPLLSGTSGSCKARIVTFPIAQQATCSQPQTSQDVFVGRWREVQMFQAANSPNPPTMTYSDLAVSFQQGQVSFGVGYEPAFADISYALTMALSRRIPSTPPVDKTKQGIPWWDEMRNNVHGKIKLSFSESKWAVLATTDPYESLDKVQIVTGPFELQQADSRISVHSKDFKIKLSSRESLVSRHSLNVPVVTSGAAFIEAPVFNFEVKMDWECLNLSAPLKSTSLSLRWSFSFRHEIFHWMSSGIEHPTHMSPASLTMNLGAHDLEWILKFCGLNCEPPHKLRSFSIWPRYKVPRVENSKNLSQMITEFMLRVDTSTFLVKYAPWDYDDPAKGLTFNVTKLKYELCYARSECNRDALDLVYQGLDLHVPKAFINNDEGFIFSSDYLKIRRQSPKANPERLLAWQEAGRKNLGMTYERSEFENGSNSDDDGDNVVIADNCQRVFLYGLKLLWTTENRDAVFSFVGLISRAFEPPKPSPSRQYKERKNFEENQKESCPKTHQGENSIYSASHGGNFSSQPIGIDRPLSSSSDSVKIEKSYDRVGNVETSESEKQGTQHFMVNVIEPQFNLHSQEANGRFLLAAVSGRVLARSFHSIMRVGVEVIKQALGTGNAQLPECSPEMTWTRMEFSVMLEHVQAHVAPTDVYPGAGLQWLPKLCRNLPTVKRARALLERVFMPCDMYFRYTRHKGGTPDLKVKPLRELTFNSKNITATMTSGQFQVMMDVLTNLLFARIPEPGKSSLQCLTEDDDVEEEADEVVPYGIEEVEIAKITLEKKERERKLLLDDIRKLSHCSDNMDTTHIEEGELWMISSRRSMLVEVLKTELLLTQKSRKAASASLRMVLQKTAQLRLMEKEKNKSPSYAMCICLRINKVVWSMLVDGKSFAEVVINDMTYDFDRDFKDIGVARFTTKCFVVRNCLPNAKSDMVLSAWNPPTEWGKEVMLRVDAKQGAPKDGNHPLELFHMEIFPLRIHLTETIYRMIWEYFFPEEEPNRLTDSQKRHVTVRSVSATVQSQRNADCVQKSKILDSMPSTSGSAQGLRRTCFLGRTLEENLAESVANELAYSWTVSSSVEKHEDASIHKLKGTKPVKSGRSFHEERKAGKLQKEKKSRPKKMMKFHNFKISQVELILTYEGPFMSDVKDLQLLMDTFHCAEFTGTWKKLFSRVQKHIICGVMKSVIGLQMKKFKGKSHNNRNSTESDDSQRGKADHHPVTWFKHQSDGAGDGFVTSIQGLFNSRKRKAKAFDFTKKSGPTFQRCSTSQQRKSLPSIGETIAFESGYSSGSSSDENFHD